MNEKNENRKALQNFFDALSEDANNKEQLKSLLKEEGIDPDALSKKGMDAIKKMQVRAKIATAKQQAISNVELAKTKLQELLPSFNQNSKELLAKLLFGDKEANLAINFNKLSELSNSDIVDMLDEAKLLELIESLNKETK